MNKYITHKKKKYPWGKANHRTHLEIWSVIANLFSVQVSQAESVKNYSNSIRPTNIKPQ